MDSPDPSHPISPDVAILEVFFPGYAILSRLVSSYLHIDLSRQLPALLALAIFTFSLRYVSTQAYYFLHKYFVSSAEIRLDDEIANYFTFWMAQQPGTKNTPRFIATTRIAPGAQYYPPDDETDNDGWNEEDELDEHGNIVDDFDEYWAKAQGRDKYKRIRFTPAVGTHYFWFRGRLLWLSRIREEAAAGSLRPSSERLIVSSLGRDPAILKELLHEAQREYVGRDIQNTVINRALKGRYGPAWTRCMARAPRPLSTVVLDAAQKQAFVDDLREYLHPRTRRWYSNRGIPYRRGYLLYGPPGTGKTSLSFAAAGLLGLEMYLMNLSSRNFDEDDFMALFHNLPRRCIVLLEDVDCAGITHHRENNAAAAAAAGIDADDDDDDIEEVIAAASGRASPVGFAMGQAAAPKSKGISLSGLLNVIDGVAASEGRILIMTTNHMDQLDSALLRPGRVDMTICFGRSGTDDIRDLFASMYTAREGDLGSASASAQQRQTRKYSTPKGGERVRRRLHDSLGRFSAREIKNLAVKFAEVIPGGEFTAAEIQGYLLNYKTEPKEAIRMAGEWVASMREKRELN